MFTCEAVEKAAKPSDIEALAEKLEPALAKAVRELITDHVAAVDLDALKDALENGRTYQVMDIIGSVDPVKAQAVRDALQDVVWQGGALAVTQTPVFNEARFAFNRLNPALITWLETYSLNLIRDIDNGTRAAVRSALLDGMTKGVNPVQQARMIKQAVGLTENQSKAVANYRKALETVHERRSLKSWGLGNKRSKLSGVEVMPVDAKGKPKDGINQWRLRDQRYDNATRRAQENKKPLTPEQIDKMVDRYQARMIQNRARTIARTESLRSTNQGVAEAWRQAIEDRKVPGENVRKRWIIAKDERLCVRCSAIFKAQPKRGIRLTERFENPKGLAPVMQPPEHPSCFPADTLVSASDRITGVTRRVYDGEMVVVRAASGKELTGTPNHPVLTERGWVALSALNEGHSLIRCLGREVVRIGDDEEHGPALIEDVARTAFHSRKMATAEVPIAAEHFHGDAADGDVAIVATDRCLGANRKAAPLKPVVHSLFDDALRFLAAKLPRLGAFDTLFFGGHPSAGCVVCGYDLSGTLLGRHQGPSDGTGLAEPARLDAVLAKNAVDDIASDAVLARELIDGCAFPIARDQVLSVRRIPFSGHVFNLETVGGHYNANGFVVHNCRCALSVRLYEPEQLQD